MSAIVIESDPVLCLGWEKLIKDCVPEIHVEFIESIAQLKSRSVKESEFIVYTLPGHYVINAQDYAAIQNLLAKKVSVLLYFDIRFIQLAINYLRLGVQASVVRSKKTADLQSAIRAIFRGERFICSLTEKGIINNLFEKAPVFSSSSADKLSKRELEVAILLAKGSSTSEIAQLLNLKSSTVSTVKNKIFTKMNISNIVQLSQQMSEY